MALLDKFEQEPHEKSPDNKGENANISKINRRDFLRQAAISAVFLTKIGALLSTYTPAEAQEKITVMKSIKEPQDARSQRLIEQWEKLYGGNGEKKCRTNCKELKETWERLGKHIDHIKLIFAEAGIPEEIAYLTASESHCKNKAYNRKSGATGAWQFIRGTGRQYGLNINSVIDERKDTILSAFAARDYLLHLYELVGSWPKAETLGEDEKWWWALVCWNRGEGSIRRDFFQEASGKYSNYYDLTTVSESKNFVPKLFGILRVLKNFSESDRKAELEYDSLRIQYEKRTRKYIEHTVKTGDCLSRIAKHYGKTVAELKRWNDLKSDTIHPNQRLKIYTQTDELSLSDISKKTDIKLATLVKLNPSIKSTKVDLPEMTFLRLPKDKGVNFIQQTADYIDNENIAISKHRRTTTRIIAEAATEREREERVESPADIAFKEYKEEVKKGEKSFEELLEQLEQVEDLYASKDELNCHNENYIENALRIIEREGEILQGKIAEKQENTDIAERENITDETPEKDILIAHAFHQEIDKTNPYELQRAAEKYIEALETIDISSDETLCRNGLKSIANDSKKILESAVSKIQASIRKNEIPSGGDIENIKTARDTLEAISQRIKFTPGGINLEELDEQIVIFYEQRDQMKNEQITKVAKKTEEIIKPKEDIKPKKYIVKKGQPTVEAVGDMLYSAGIDNNKLALSIAKRINRITHHIQPGDIIWIERGTRKTAVVFYDKSHDQNWYFKDRRLK